jgi:hypothetical protein
MIQHLGRPQAPDLPGGLGQKSGNGLDANGSEPVQYTISEISTQLNSLYLQIEGLENLLDGGNTDVILEGIANGMSSDSLLALLEESGETSSEVVQALLNSQNEDHQFLVNNLLLPNAEEDDLLNPDMIEPTSLELEIADLKGQTTKQWNNLIRSMQTDTTGAFPIDEVLTVLNTFEPDHTAQRMASILSWRTGANSPAWTSIENDLNTEAELYLPEGIELTNDISMFHDSVISQHANVHALNAAYIQAELSYDPPSYNFEGDLAGSYPVAQAKSAAIEESKNSNVQIIPNPFKESFMMIPPSVDDFEQVTLTLHDIRGRQIKQLNFAEGQPITVNLAGQPAGVYLYTLQVDNQKPLTGKLVKMD